jgi:hypothetical protein
MGLEPSLLAEAGVAILQGTPKADRNSLLGNMTECGFMPHWIAGFFSAGFAKEILPEGLQLSAAIRGTMSSHGHVAVEGSGRPRRLLRTVSRTRP